MNFLLEYKMQQQSVVDRLVPKSDCLLLTGSIDPITDDDDLERSGSRKCWSKTFLGIEITAWDDVDRGEFLFLLMATKEQPKMSCWLSKPVTWCCYSWILTDAMSSCCHLLSELDQRQLQLDIVKWREEEQKNKRHEEEHKCQERERARIPAIWQTDCLECEWEPSERARHSRLLTDSRTDWTVQDPVARSQQMTSRRRDSTKLSLESTTNSLELLLPIQGPKRNSFSPLASELCKHRQSQSKLSLFLWPDDHNTWSQLIIQFARGRNIIMFMAKTEAILLLSCNCIKLFDRADSSTCDYYIRTFISCILVFFSAADRAKTLLCTKKFFHYSDPTTCECTVCSGRKILGAESRVIRNINERT